MITILLLLFSYDNYDLCDIMSIPGLCEVLELIGQRIERPTPSATPQDCEAAACSRTFFSVLAVGIEGELCSRADGDTNSSAEGQDTLPTEVPPGFARRLGCVRLTRFERQVFIDLADVVTPGMNYTMEVGPGVARDMADNWHLGSFGEGAIHFAAVGHGWPKLRVGGLLCRASGGWVASANSRVVDMWTQATTTGDAALVGRSRRLHIWMC